MYKKILFTTLAVIIILTGISGIVGYIWQQEVEPNISYDGRLKLPTIPDHLNNTRLDGIPPLPNIPEPAVLNNYAGPIIELAADKLVLSTNRGNKTVRFNASTIFEKIFIPRFPSLPPLPGEPAKPKIEIPDSEIISLQDLQSGQDAAVFSSDNISGQNEFTADKISLVIKLAN